jgi:hypothetical protein
VTRPSIDLRGLDRQLQLVEASLYWLFAANIAKLPELLQRTWLRLSMRFEGVASEKIRPCSYGEYMLADCRAFDALDRANRSGNLRRIRRASCGGRLLPRCG